MSDAKGLIEAANAFYLAAQDLARHGQCHEYVHDAWHIFTEEDGRPKAEELAKYLQDLSLATFKLPFKQLSEALAALPPDPVILPRDLARRLLAQSIIYSGIVETDTTKELRSHLAGGT